MVLQHISVVKSPFGIKPVKYAKIAQSYAVMPKCQIISLVSGFDAYIRSNIR